MRRFHTLFACLATAISLVAHSGSALAQSSDTYEVEFTGGSTLRLPGSRAFVSLSDGRTTRTADSGEHTSLPLVGFAVSRWGRTLGSFMDLSYVDGGTASASIGSYTSEVSSHVVDFHGGIQAQFPGGRVRPYVIAGGGFARSSNSVAFSGAGGNSNSNQADWLSSLIYGGGVRLGLTDTVGVKAGIEGVTVTPVKSSSTAAKTSYGRFVVGMFYSGKPARPVTAPHSPAPPAFATLAPALPQTDTIRQTIAEIRGGVHGTIPPAQMTGKNRGGATTLAVTNSTEYTLYVFLSGSESQALNLSPGATQKVAIDPGEYEIAARVSAQDVIPFYGTQAIVGGNAYSESFYIATR
jgi:hypothetical protein